MKPSNNQALNQALDSIGAIRSHLELMPLSETIAYDAVCMRLFQIGEVTTWQFRSFADLENASY